MTHIWEKHAAKTLSLGLSLVVLRLNRAAIMHFLVYTVEKCLDDAAVVGIFQMYYLSLYFTIMPVSVSMYQTILSNSRSKQDFNQGCTTLEKLTQ